MGLRDRLKSLRDRLRRKEETIEVVASPPSEISSIKSIDYGTATQERTGGTTVTTTVSSSGGRSSSRTTVSSVGKTPSTSAPSVQQAKATTQQQAKQTQAQLQQQAKASAIQTQYLASRDKAGSLGQAGQFTVQDTGRRFESPVTPYGRIYQVQTGEVQGVPVTDTYTSPSITAISYGAKTRKATDEEIKYLLERNQALELTNPTWKQKVSAKAYDVGEFIGVDLSRENLQTPTYNVEAVQESFKSAYGEKIGGFAGGVVTGIIPSTRGEILSTGVTFGIGAGAGAGFTTAERLTAKIGGKVGKYIPRVIRTTELVGGGILGVAYGTQVVGGVINAGSPEQAGEIVGEAGREILSFGAGYKAGGKGANIIIDRIETAGRVSEPNVQAQLDAFVESGKTFPTAPTEQHLSLFLETTKKYPLITETVTQNVKISPSIKMQSGQFSGESIASLSSIPSTKNIAGGFHTTPMKFWPKGKGFISQAGTSELRGTYAGSEISIAFSGLTGGGLSGYSPSNLFKSISLAGGSPAVAFIKPEGFRVNKFVGKARKPIVENGVRVQDFADFSKPAKEGIIDIPQMKTEIEGILREGQSVVFESGKYYVEYEGRRIALDTFLTENSERIKIKDEGGKKIKIKDLEDVGYSLSSLESVETTIPTVSSSRGSSRKSSVSSSISSSITSSSITSSSIYPSSARSSIKSSKSSPRSSISSILSSITSSSSPSSSRRSIISSYTSKQKSISFPKIQRRRIVQPRQNGVTVELRRYGKFKPIGTFGSIQKAINVGREKAGSTLGATFRISGASTKGIATPKGFYRKKDKKKGTLFIEKSKYRLSKKGEKVEIQTAKRRKKK
jgi:hypothetical protein